MMRRMSAESTRLSDREHDVLLLLADGANAAAIGQQLYMSESTVKSHIARIYQKLGRQQPRPGTGHRDADRPALQRAAQANPESTRSAVASSGRFPRFPPSARPGMVRKD